MRVITRILFYFIWLLVAMCVAIFLIGIFETMRNEYFFPIVEDNLINPANTPAEIYDDYLEMRNSYIFTNQPFISLMNFLGLALIFGIFVQAWRIGRRSLPYKPNDIFNSYSLFLVLGFYLIIVVFDYLVGIFVSQLIELLFNDIVTAIFVFELLLTYFPWLVLFAVFLTFLSNQIKYFDVTTN